MKSLLQEAFFQFYRQLMMIRSFAIMNSTGFGKILKKHDKYCVRPLKSYFRQLMDERKPAFESRRDLQELMAATEVRTTCGCLTFSGAIESNFRSVLLFLVRRRCSVTSSSTATGTRPWRSCA